MRKTRHRRRRTRRRRSRKMRGGVSLASLNPFTENDKGEGGWLSKLNPFGKKKTAPVTAGMPQPEGDEVKQPEGTWLPAGDGEALSQISDNTPTPDDGQERGPPQQGGKKRRRRRKSKKRGGGCGCASPMTGGKRKRRRRRTHKKKRKSRRRRR